MKLITLNFILSLIIVQNCSVEKTGVWKNEDIQSETKQQIKFLNDMLLEGISTNDVNSIKRIAANDFIAKADQSVDKFIGGLNSVINSESYHILDEYYFKNSSTGESTIIPSGMTGEKDYFLSVPTWNKEMYVVLMISNNRDNNLLIAAIYGKYKNEWKLNFLESGQYGFFGKDAIDYFNLALKNFDNSYLVDALINISVANVCLTPINGIWHYRKENEIKQFQEKVMKEVRSKYQLPITLNAISSRPRLFRIYPEKTDREFVPMIFYVSSINLKDNISLIEENNRIKEECAKLFHGLRHDKSYVFYRAYNEIPDGTKKTDYYGFVDDVEN